MLLNLESKELKKVMVELIIYLEIKICRRLGIKKIEKDKKIVFVEI